MSGGISVRGKRTLPSQGAKLGSKVEGRGSGLEEAPSYLIWCMYVQRHVQQGRMADGGSDWITRIGHWTVLATRRAEDDLVTRRVRFRCSVKYEVEDRAGIRPSSSWNNSRASRSRQGRFQL